MKKKSLALLAALSTLALVSCGNSPYIGENGNWWIGSSDLGVAAQGPQGEKGDKGDPGATGSTGEQGPQGSQGETGTAGSQGEKGDTGATGSQGPRGPQGETGQTGPAGQDGSSILTGNVDPVDSQGNNGDSYINTTTGDVFVKADDVWTKTGNIKGPQGETGESGQSPYIGENGNWWVGETDTGIKAQGDQGDKGDSGKNGSSISSGSTDPSNAQGSDGDSYINMTTGDYYVKVNGSWLKTGNIKGPQGEQGEKGDKGDTGLTGATGQTPYIGSNGNWWIGESDTGVKAQGEKGAKGDTGLTGATGTAGQNGVSITGVECLNDSGYYVYLVDEYPPYGPEGSIVGAEGAHYYYLSPYSGEITDNREEAEEMAAGTGSYSYSWFIGGNATELTTMFDSSFGLSGVNCINPAYGVKAYKINFSNGGEYTYYIETPYISNDGYWWVGQSSTGIKAQGEKGEKGAEIVSVTKTGTSDAGDVYTITFNDGSTIDFTVEKDVQCEHEWSLFYTLQEKTCTQDGKYIYSCDKCEITKGVTAPKEHSFVTEKVNSSTHSTRCEFCGLEQSVEDHTYGDDMICTACGFDPYEGLFTYKLNKAGTEYTLTKSVTNIPEEITIPSVYKGKPVTAIDQYAFYAKTKIKSLAIPSSVKYIGNSAFSMCSNIENLVIQDGVEEIGVSAFAYCSKLESVSIPESVTYICDGAFGFCNKVSSISVDENNANYEVIQGMLYEKDTKTLKLYPATLSAETVSIPEGTERIGYQAFGGCSNVKTITMPDSVAYIEYEAFAYCNNLSSITLSEMLGEIGGYAFRSCESLTKLSIPDSVIKIGEGLMTSCTNLKTITLSECIPSIESYTFYECSSLTNVYLPDSVSYIGDWAFAECTSLTSVFVPYAVTGIGEYAFYQCSSLESVSLSGTTDITPSLFQGCSSLTNLEIPHCVTTIDCSAFTGCSSISLSYDGTTEDWNKIDLYNTGSNNINVVCTDGSVLLPVA